MNTMSLQELAHDPIALLERVEAGEHIVVVREGRPVAELRPVASRHVATRPFGLAAGAFTVPDDFDSAMATAIGEKIFVVCIDDHDVEDLSRGMVYRLMPDEQASLRGFLRVIDDSGEDYLYPCTRFVPIDVPPTLVSQVAAAIRPIAQSTGECRPSLDFLGNADGL